MSEWSFFEAAELVDVAIEQHDREVYQYPAYLQDRDKMVKETYMDFEQWIEYQRQAIEAAKVEAKRLERMRTRPAEDILAEAEEIRAKVAEQKAGK